MERITTTTEMVVCLYQCETLMPNIYLLRLIGKDFKFIMYKYRIVLSAHLMEHRADYCRKQTTHIATHTRIVCVRRYVYSDGVCPYIAYTLTHPLPSLHIGKCVCMCVLYKYNLTYRGHHRKYARALYIDLFRTCKRQHAM